MIALLLDLSNIVGGFVLAIALLQTHSAGSVTTWSWADAAIRPYAGIVGVVALVAGGYDLIVTPTSGPHVFHFEVVGIAVGVALLRDRLLRRPVAKGARVQPPPSRADRCSSRLLGLIAILVGIQGLFTPD